MNDAKKEQKRARKAERRKVGRKVRELVHLRARDLKGKPRLYPKPGEAVELTPNNVFDWFSSPMHPWTERGPS